MKNKLKITTIVLCMLIFVFFFLSQNRNFKIKDSVFNNVEALASGESGDVKYHCFGEGTVDCDGEKVEMKITGYSFDYE